jgi:acyl-CoA dehydrogenase
MGWDFETDEDFQRELEWVDDFVRREVEPLDLVLGSEWDIHAPLFGKLVRPLQALVRESKLWACHLGPELGGRGYGQVKLALLNEILGRSRFGPIVFGCQAPDSGNSEILAHYGTAQQKERYLKPLLENQIVSCFSMTEPQGGADPQVFTTRAVRAGDEWVIDGQKWFSSNAAFAEFFIVMAVTDPDAPPHERMSMFIVPAATKGIRIVRNVQVAGEPEATHAYIHWEGVRVPLDAMLGQRGQAFVVAQTRLGGGRVHHAMRTLGKARMAFDMMCERALSRHTQGEQLARKQMVQEKIADSWIELEQFRLLLLRTAWRIDKFKDYRKVRGDIAAIKVAMPRVLHDVAQRALQVHGSLGVSTEMPFADMIVHSYHLALADGPTEVHKVTLARQVLAQYEAGDSVFPGYHLPALRQQAEQKFAAALAELAASR